MSKFWLNFRIVVFLLVAGYLLALLLVNRHETITVDLVFKQYQANMLLVLFMTSVLSIFGWWLMRAIIRTWRQVRDVRARARMERMTREAQDVVAKANKVQTK